MVGIQSFARALTTGICMASIRRKRARFEPVTSGRVKRYDALMITKTLINQLREFDTPLLANTIGYIDDMPDDEYYMGGSIRCMTPTLTPMVGVAFTCEIDSSSPDREKNVSPFFEQVARMYDSQLPVVWVVRGVGSRPDHECLVGDGMAKNLRSAGCIGAVCEGGARDFAGCMATGFSVFCKGPVPHHTPFYVESTDQPVQVGGITINPGDILHGDGEGVIKIPATCAEALPERAIAMRGVENEFHVELGRDDISQSRKSTVQTEYLRKYGFDV